jgi:hypothetical protein
MEGEGKLAGVKFFQLYATTTLGSCVHSLHCLHFSVVQRIVARLIRAHFAAPLLSLFAFEEPLARWLLLLFLWYSSYSRFRLRPLDARLAELGHPPSTGRIHTQPFRAGAAMPSIGLCPSHPPPRFQ